MRLPARTAGAGRAQLPAPTGLMVRGAPPSGTPVAHQLAWCASGLLSVRAPGGTWLLPPSVALWIPAHAPHATGATSTAVMCSPYIAPAHCPVAWPEPTVVAVPPLLRELINHGAARSVAACPGACRGRAVRSAPAGAREGHRADLADRSAGPHGGRGAPRRSHRLPSARRLESVCGCRRPHAGAAHRRAHSGAVLPLTAGADGRPGGGSRRQWPYHFCTLFTRPCHPATLTPDRRPDPDPRVVHPPPAPPHSGR